MAYTNIGLVEYAEKCLALGENSVYVYGTYGNKLTTSLATSKNKQYPKINTSTRTTKYKKLCDGKHYAFDCVGLIKSYYWGGYGNTKYKSSSDVSANGMYSKAKVKGNIKTLDKTKPGLLVQMDGHIGVSDGKGYAIECTISTKHAKQKHGLGGMCRTKLSDRPWEHWLECPYIEYVEETKPATTTKPASTSSLKYAKNNKIILNGYLYKSSNGTGKGAKKTNHKGVITLVEKGAVKPYHIDKLGWVAESDIKLQSTVSYYPKCSIMYLSIVSALNSIGVNSSIEYRKKIADKNGISNYKGSATQNIKMLNLLKKGKLIKV